MYRSVVECANVLLLSLFIDDPDGLFNFPIGHMRQNFCVKHKPPHCDSITTAFCYSAIMSGVSCLKSMWLAASIQLYEPCWHLSPFAMAHWKSWAWCVLIWLCALCIVCVVFGLVVFCLHRLEGNGRGGTSAFSFITLVWWKWPFGLHLGLPEKWLFEQRSSDSVTRARKQVRRRVDQNWPSLCCVLSAYSKLGTRTLPPSKCQDALIWQWWARARRQFQVLLCRLRYEKIRQCI